MTGKPTLKEMAREAVLAHGGRATFAQIKAYALEHYDSVNPNALNCQVNSACVNVQARVNYPENQRRRVCHAGKSPDLFFKTARGEVEIYDPQKHGEWEIAQDGAAHGGGELIVRPVGNPPPPPPPPPLPPPSSGMTASQLDDLRRSLFPILDGCEGVAKSPKEAVGHRVDRLAKLGRLSQEIEAWMQAILKYRNRAVYEGRLPSATEAVAIRSAWKVVEEWATSKGYLPK